LSWRETGEGVVNDRLTAIGTGQAVRSVSVRTLVSGQIDTIPVRPGGRVERGDVLIHLDAARGGTRRRAGQADRRGRPSPG
jgi:multidrug efflux pump subunit AcrA (membrane-fusion protein)